MSNRRKPRPPGDSNHPPYWQETCDGARDAIAFVTAVHRDDTEAIAAIWNNSEPFDLAHMTARYFIDFIKCMAVTSPGCGDPDAEVEDFLRGLQAEQRRSA